MNDEKKLTVKETFDLAVQNHQEGRIDVAQEFYNQVLKINPNYANAHNNLGVIYKDLGQYQKAKNYFEKITEINPNYANAHNNLGAIFKELGQHQKAKECFEKAIKINPNYADAHHNLGIIFEELGESQKTISCFEKTIAINSNYTDAHYNLISTLIKQSKFKEAELSYQKAIELIPNFNNNDIRFNSNNLHKLSRLDKAISLNPNIKNTLISSGKNLSSTNLQFSSPSPLEYEEFYRKGMGTENIGGFLRALAQMVRPNRILEIGAGYTTPFLLEALINNERVFNDGNLEEAYFKNYDYAPKLVVIDDMSLDDLMKKPGMNNLITSKYIDFIEGKFEDKADLLLNKYRNFDFVWFDCGGTTEYEIFMDQYWHLCSGYVLFHFTYSNGKPNSNHNTLLDKIIGNPSIFDIVEPHKNRQGSITMINKHLSKIKKDTE
jgi:tetratricopeptide (TPR) repeat protein